MFIQKMTRSECLGTLAGARLGRLACAQGDQPYAVPFYFVYHDPYLYGFTTPGQKTEWMRRLRQYAGFPTPPAEPGVQ